MISRRGEHCHAPDVLRGIQIKEIILVNDGLLKADSVLSDQLCAVNMIPLVAEQNLLLQKDDHVADLLHSIAVCVWK